MLESPTSSSSNLSSTGSTRLFPAKIRIERGFKELKSLPRTVTITFPIEDDKMNFSIIVKPNSGFYKGGIFKFAVNINDNYPIDPPKVKCVPKIYHPNIDLQGNVCLNILREEWSPALDMYNVIMGLVVLFNEPNPSDPLNKEAANTLSKDISKFQRNVKESMKGYYVLDEKYDDVIHY